MENLAYSTLANDDALVVVLGPTPYRSTENTRPVVILSIVVANLHGTRAASFRAYVEGTCFIAYHDQGAIIPLVMII